MTPTDTPLTVEQRAEKIVRHVREFMEVNPFMELTHFTAAEMEAYASDAIAENNRECKEGGEWHTHNCPVMREHVKGMVADAVRKAVEEEVNDQVATIISEAIEKAKAEAFAEGKRDAYEDAAKICESVIHEEKYDPTKLIANMIRARAKELIGEKHCGCGFPNCDVDNK